MFVVILLYTSYNEVCYNNLKINNTCTNQLFNCTNQLFNCQFCEAHEFPDNEIYNLFNNSKGFYSSLSKDITELAIVLFVFLFSLVFSTLFVSNCVYKIMVNEFVDKFNSNTTLYAYDPYFYKSLDEYDVLDKHELSCVFLNSLGNKYIKETTPCGIVILTYNNEYNSFDYYCKKSNSVGFNYLEVVSRIYVVNFGCKSIYSDNYDNLVMLYNMKYGITNINYNVDNDANNANNSNNSNVFFVKKVASKKSDLLTFVSNKYKYKGTIDEFYNYCKINGLTICYNENDNENENETIKDVSENSVQDSNSCFFSLEKERKQAMDDLDCNKTIDFKTFKSFNFNKK
jgi:hypothetical protein